MSLSIDHVVVLVSDLDTAIANYGALGFTVVPGGEHTDGATHNALIAFADGSYLELIAFKRAAPEHRWWRHVALGEGLIDFALLPSDIARDVAAARARGLEIEGPTPGGRLRPDGERIDWQIGRAATPDLPFLCADITPRERRVPAGEAVDHANGVLGIAWLLVAVADLTTSAARYEALLGVEQRQTNLALTSPDSATASFSLGESTITLLAPAPGEPADGPVDTRLAKYGEGPYALALQVGPQSQISTIDPLETHGVRLQLVS